MEEKETLSALLDAYEGDSRLRAEDISGMVSDDLSASDLQRLQVLDEAVNRRWWKRVDVDAEWSKFAAQRMTAIPPRRRAKRVWMLTMAAACVALAVLMVTRRESLERDGVSDIKITHYANVPTVTSETRQSVVRPVVVGAQKMNEVRVAGKRMLSMTLADGTRVWLNANSRLRYADDFSKTHRTVELDGEAYFDVAHDAAHPFIIKAKGIVTRVLGTQFNIRCYDANDIHVTLVEGSIEVQAPASRLTLSPDQDARFCDCTWSVQTVNTRDYTSWREGVMYFDDATLRTILKQLSGWYGVNVVCRDDELLDKHFHFVYQLEGSLEEAIDVLNESANLGIVVNDSSILIE